MSKIVYLFSGQGSQYPGMGAEFIEKISSSSDVLSEGSDILGYDLKEKLLSASAEELAQTEVSQPCIFTMSLLALNAAQEAGIEAFGAAGHSLGEYAAMVAAGIVSRKDGFRLIKARAEAMGKAAKASGGAMAAVLGLSAEKIEEICANVSRDGDYVAAVNYNSPVQTVIAGTKSAIEKAKELLSSAGAKRVVPLAVSAAFHSEMMRPAAEEFLAFARTVEFKKGNIPFYSNVTGALFADFPNMAETMAKHICSPVRFTAELNAIHSDGFDTFLELGPGKVLTGLVKKTLDGVTAANIENIAGIEALER